ncbi:hypothetical protein [Mangrovicoccus ximenensis]|uniref:hypothetical protein n=1 Tax=Mangrovicoccus ximenensis TaxID=1911570 RepID=UPI000D3A1F91|nr:hypothetical protein [Mangrovicoccus ximenensis]
MTADVFVLYPPDLDKDFDTALANLGFGLNPAGLHRRYRREALRLNTLSDFDLGMLGIERAEIPAYVMRDTFSAFAARFAFCSANS